MLGYVLTKHGQLAQADEALNHYLNIERQSGCGCFCQYGIDAC